MNLFDGKSKNNDVMCGISFKTIYCLKSQRAKAEVLVFGNINNDLDSFKFSRCAILFHYFSFLFLRYPPWFDDNAFRIYEKIIEGRLEWPKHIDPVAK